MSLNNCSTGIPFSEDFLAAVSVPELVCIVFSGVISLMTLSLFIENIVCLSKGHEIPGHTSILFKSTIILGVYPAVSLFSFFALCFPRAHLVCDLCGSIYISIGMYNFITLLLDYFGGMQELLRQTANDQIRLCFAPLCCCCIPPFKVTRKVLNIVHLLVGQNAVLQIVISFISLVLWLDGKYIIGEISASNASIYMTVAKATSTVLGMGGLRLMVNICKPIDEKLNVATRSRVLIVVLLLHNVQGLVFNILAFSDIPECSSELSTGVQGRAWNNMILIVEMFLLGVAARCLYQRPLKSNYAISINDGYNWSENPTDTDTSSPANTISQDALSDGKNIPI